MQIRALVRMEPQALIRVGFHDLQRQRHRFALNEYYNLYSFIFLPQKGKSHGNTGGGGGGGEIFFFYGRLMCHPTYIRLHMSWMLTVLVTRQSHACTYMQFLPAEPPLPPSNPPRYVSGVPR